MCIRDSVNATLNLLDSRNNPVFDLLALTGGFGISNKMPTLMYLYPDYAYFDNASLSKYGTETKDRLGLITTDVVKNTANPDLRPARSTKWEAGLSFRINKMCIRDRLSNAHGLMTSFSYK